VTLGLQQAELKTELDELQEMYYKILPFCQKAFVGERKKAARDAMDTLHTLSSSSNSNSHMRSTSITQSLWE
jgi:hypothetical protein